MNRFEELLTMPRPVIVKVTGTGEILKLYAGAPAFNSMVPTDAPAENVMVVVDEGPNEAVPVGTVGGTQLLAVFQFPVAVGLQVASWA